MRRAAFLVTVLLLTASVGVGVTTTGTATGHGSLVGEPTPVAAPSSLATDGSAAALQQSFDRSVVKIRVHADGSARWTFRYERTLETDAEREDFAAYAAEFNENETALYESFRADATDLVAEGSNQTGREMAATDFSRSATIESSLGNDLGVVELSFTWDAFAEVDGDRVVVGDVFEGGLYIGPDQELVFAAGEGVVFESVAPDATQSNPESLRESETVTWTGERQFTDQRPRVVLVPAPSGATATATGSTATPGTTTPSEAGAGGGPNWLPLVAVVVLALVGFVWYRERSPAASSPLAALDPRNPDGDGAVGVAGDESPGGDDGPAAGSRSSTGTGYGAEADADGGTAAGAAGAASAAGAANRGAEDGEPGEEAAADAAAEPAVPDEAFLSDEDRVRKLLRENGGRMKQVRIVEETGWSKSKVSVLLSEMEEDDVISKLRVGRENVVSLEGHEPEAARSPFQDGDGDDAE